MTSNYVSIRDDVGLKSLSVNERDFLRSCALRGAVLDENDGNYRTDASGSNTVGGGGRQYHHQQEQRKVMRYDGRRGSDVRKVRLNLQRWDNGSGCTVQWGSGTRVTATCTSQLVPPSSPDRPSEGVVDFAVDISPMASSIFKLAPAISTAGGGSAASQGGGTQNHSDSSQRLLSNRILRCLERIVVIGGALDTEALVLQAGKWVWRIRVSLTVLDDGGNLLDACVLAALASLRHYRKPQVQFLPAEMSGTPTSAGKTSAQKSADSDDDNNSAGLPVLVPSTVKEATPLPLHHTPLSISFGLIPGEETNGGGGISNTGSSLPSSSSTIVALIDPSDREELVQSGSLTIAMNIHSEVCLLDYGGGCELAPSKLRECWITAETAIKGLCELLEMTIAEADERAQNDQLRRLQLQRKQLEGSGHADDFVALSLPPLPSSDRKNTPYLHEMEDIDDLQVAESSAPDSTELNMIDQAQTEAEEAYRRQALDYSINHLPSAVRESNEDGKSGDTSLASAHAHAGSLLAAMLQSVCHNSSAPAANEVHSSGERKHRSNSVSATTESKSTLKRSPEEPSGKEYTMDLDGCIGDDVVDDEEEPTTSMLESEFRAGSTVPAPSDDKATSAAQNNVRGFVDDDVEIDDFSMAIKSKKSKNKKKISKKSR